MSVADEIKARLDIVNYIQQYAPLKKAGRYYKANCPFHSERTPSFVVNPETQSWRCFGACAEGGDVFSFAMKLHGWNFREALEALGNQVGVEVYEQTPEDRQRDDRRDHLRGLLAAAADSYHKKLVEGATDDAQATLAYTREKRGFTDATINEFNIGYAPPGWQNMLEELIALGYVEDDIIEAGLAVKNEDGRVYDRFRNRLMIPIRDDRGRVVGFGARALSDEDNPKYLNSPQTPVFDKSRILFGLDMAKRAIRDSETAVIVEGYMDVIQAHQAGFANVVAQMGTAMTETQLKLLVPRYAKKVILALDSDAAGQSATRRSLETARQTLESDYAGRLSADIRVLQIPGAKDPDDLIRESPDEWQGLIDAAIPVADFVINMEMAELAENATIQERETVARSILPLLVASESDLYRKDNIQKLAMRLHIPERSLLAWANEQSQIQNWKSRAARADADKDQPPPPDYDSMEPPPDIDGEDNHFASSARRAIGAAFDSPDNSLEARTLRILFTQTNFYYLVNRRFRELAVGNPALQHGPLGELCAEDFTRSAYRELMKVFIQAVGQQEMDVIDFPPKNIDPFLKREYDQLFIEDADGIRRRVQHRFSHDISDVLKRQDRYARPGLNLGEELLEKALQLRLRRIKQEMDELRFIQLDAQQQLISQPDSLQLGIRIFHLVRARQLLEPELQQQASRLI